MPSTHTSLAAYLVVVGVEAAHQLAPVRLLLLLKLCPDEDGQEQGAEGRPGPE